MGSFCNLAAVVLTNEKKKLSFSDLCEWWESGGFVLMEKWSFFLFCDKPTLHFFFFTWTKIFKQSCFSVFYMWSGPVVYTQTSCTRLKHTPRPRLLAVWSLNSNESLGQFASVRYLPLTIKSRHWKRKEIYNSQKMTNMGGFQGRLEKQIKASRSCGLFPYSL